jgi:GST-like protein
MIDLHYVATANGMKAVIALEEMGLPYNVLDYPLFDGKHLTPEFRKLNPNNKLPVIVDHAPSFGGGPMPVFETGAILIYLAEKSGKFLPADPRQRMVALQWLVWQVAGHGPMNGQAHHFIRYAPEGQDYGINRYRREVLRLLNVLEFRLAESEYLAAEYSIADMAVWPWVQGSSLIDIDIAEFPAVARWSNTLLARSAIVRAISGEKTAVPDHYMQKRAKLTAEQWSNTFGDKMHGAAKAR